MKQVRKIVEFLYTVVLCWVGGITLYFILMLIAFFLRSDHIYEECMERCVLPDNSNYVECANSTCDYPI